MRKNKSGNLSIPGVTSIVYPDLNNALETLIEQHPDFNGMKKGTLIKWLLWAGIHAFCDDLDKYNIVIEKPAAIGGFRYDLDDSAHRQIINEHMALMRNAKKK